MAVRLKDIARELGLSAVTISKVLRNHSDIGPETRERVLKRVKELNYQPNLIARGLATGRSFLVGLVVPELLHPFFAEIAKSISAELAKKGFYLIISSSEENPVLEEHQINQLLGRKLDALIVASSSFNPGLFARIKEHETPLILIDRSFPGFEASYVGIDDELVGFIATDHLIRSGCARVAHIRGPTNSPGIGRLEGYRRALVKHGRKSADEYIISEPFVDIDSPQRGAEATVKLLKMTPRPDGIFCFNDPMAIGVIDTIVEAGLSVPGDIAVIGCGNLHYDSSLRVPLSSIDQQSSAIGEKAARIALNLIEARKPMRLQTIILKPKLVLRSSTRPTTLAASGKRGAK